MKQRMATMLLIGVLLGSGLMLVLGSKSRSVPPVGTYQMSVQEDGSKVWVLNTSTGNLYRCTVHTASWDIFGGAPD
jgi:hypothetical protein